MRFFWIRAMYVAKIRVDLMFFFFPPSRLSCFFVATAAASVAVDVVVGCGAAADVGSIRDVEKMNVVSIMNNVKNRVDLNTFLLLVVGFFYFYFYFYF